MCSGSGSTLLVFCGCRWKWWGIRKQLWSYIICEVFGVCSEQASVMAGHISSSEFKAVPSPSQWTATCQKPWLSSFKDQLTFFHSGRVITTPNMHRRLIDLIASQENFRSSNSAPTWKQGPQRPTNPRATAKDNWPPALWYCWPHWAGRERPTIGWNYRDSSHSQHVLSNRIPRYLTSSSIFYTSLIYTSSNVDCYFFSTAEVQGRLQ